jgi:hypothetical protein
MERERERKVWMEGERDRDSITGLSCGNLSSVLKLPSAAYLSIDRVLVFSFVSF